MKGNHRVHEPVCERLNPVCLCVRAEGTPGRLDGDTSKPFWQQGTWMDDFHDIEGDSRPRPNKYTRVKVLWTDEALYIAAELQDDQVWATVERRDELIYVDNDFEVFLAPQPTTHRYYELEMNANNAVWDLMMEKPSRDCVRRIIGWDIHGLESAVKVHGRLNDPSCPAVGWSLELKLPWFSLRECGLDECYPTHFAPNVGEIWRMNFSRVEWQADVADGKYVKRTDPETGRELPEYNWVWAPTGVIDIHMPEMWGYLIFTDHGESYPLPAEDEVRFALRKIYYKQHAYCCEHGNFCGDARLLVGDALAEQYSMKAYTTPSMFECVAKWKDQFWHIRQDGYVWKEGEE